MVPASCSFLPRPVTAITEWGVGTTVPTVTVWLP